MQSGEQNEAIDGNQVVAGAVGELAEAHAEIVDAERVHQDAPGIGGGAGDPGVPAQKAGFPWPLGRWLPIKDEEYFAAPAWGSSNLKVLLNRSPAHALVPTEQTPAMAFGSLFHHIALIEGSTRSLVVRPKVEGRTTSGKAINALFETQLAAGKVEVSQAQFDAADGMLKSLQASKVWKALTADGEAEQGAFIAYGDTFLRAKPDWRNDRLKIVVNLKTSADASPEEFSRSIVNYGYAMQAALERAVVTEVTKEVYSQVFVVVEKTAPYAVSFYTLDDESRLYGETMLAKALEKLDECVKAKSFPSYPEKIVTIGVPTWALKNQEA